MPISGFNKQSADNAAVVCLVTAYGLKDMGAVRSLLREPPTIELNIQHF